MRYDVIGYKNGTVIVRCDGFIMLVLVERFHTIWDDENVYRTETRTCLCIILTGVR